MKLTQKSKYYIAAALSALVIIIGGIVLVNFNSPIEKFKRLIEKDDYVTAMELYNSKLTDDTSDSRRAIGFVRNEMDVILDEFKAGSRDYQTVASELNAFEKIPELAEDVLEIRSEIERFQASFIAYATAEDFYSKENYMEAITWYQQVIAEDSNFQTAQQKLEESVQKYRDEVVKKVDEFAAKEQYSDAVTLLMQAMPILPDDTVLQQKWNTVSAEQESYLLEQEIAEIDQLLKQKDFLPALEKATAGVDTYNDVRMENKYQETVKAYESDIKSQVEALLKKKDLEGAQQKVNELSLYVTDSKVAEQLGEEIRKYYPVKLTDLNMINDGNCVARSRELIKDNRGNIYEWGIVYDAGNYRPDPERQIYMLNKLYKKFRGTIAVHEESSSDENILFKIYARDENRNEVELYSCTVGLTSQPISFEVDITGVDQLVIEFIFTGWLNSEYILAEPEVLVESL